MQPRSEGFPVLALPRLWVSNLKRALDLDTKGLSLRFSSELTEIEFKLNGRIDSRHARGVKRVFERIEDEGHWPDCVAYEDSIDDEDSESGRDTTEGRLPKSRKYNLFVRVSKDVPGSQDWLFRDLKRAAQGQPLVLSTIRESISSHLHRFGLARLDPTVAIFIAQQLPSGMDKFVDSLLAPTWRRLAESGEALHVELLTLFWQEAVCERLDSITPLLDRYCHQAWANLLDRMQTPRNKRILKMVEPDIEELLERIRRPLEISTILPRPKAGFRHGVLCPVWLPSPAGQKAEQRLMECALSLWVERVHEQRIGNSASRRQSREKSFSDVVPACEIVLTQVARAKGSWSTWKKAFGSSKLDKLKHQIGRAP